MWFTNPVFRSALLTMSFLCSYSIKINPNQFIRMKIQRLKIHNTIYNITRLLLLNLQIQATTFNRIMENAATHTYALTHVKKLIPLKNEKYNVRRYGDLCRSISTHAIQMALISPLLFSPP